MDLGQFTVHVEDHGDMSDYIAEDLKAFGI